ncbi:MULTISPECIES: guanylate kinase [unclassified Helicobacter]|uniref:guanylate kinase n=1 Tax=unclassified Helicobacter TaxID=2593540 RepID=UPI000CF0DF8B|nr:MULTISPECIES: guanylate kinase [unclassified Helicobacter]
MCGNILILSGPSGSGKSTLCKALKDNFPNIFFSISTTTRPPRFNEKDGREYFFTTEEKFLEDIKAERFLEWAKVHQNYYGTSLVPVKEALQDGKLVVFDVDVQGHKNIKEHFPKLAKSVFITTQNDLILQQRLEKRGTDTQEIIQNRIKNAYEEMLFMDAFDFLIINNDIQDSIKKILSIASLLSCMNFDSQAICQNWKTIQK